MKNTMNVTIANANAINKIQLIKAVEEYFRSVDILSIFSSVNNGLIILTFDGITACKWYCDDTQKFINGEYKVALIDML